MTEIKIFRHGKDACAYCKSCYESFRKMMPALPRFEQLDLAKPGVGCEIGDCKKQEQEKKGVKS